MAVRPRAHVSDRLAVAKHDLGMKQHRLGIFHQHLDQPAPRRTGGLLLEHGVTPDETQRFVELYEKSQPGFKRIVGVVDVMSVVAVAFFQSQAGKRLQSGVAKPEAAPGLDQTIIDMARLLCRDIELVSEFPDICNANTEDARIADVDLAGSAERKGFVRKIGAGQRLQECTGLGTLNVDLTIAGG